MNSLVVFTLLLGFASPGLAQELSKRERTQLEHRLRAQKISEAISIDDVRHVVVSDLKKDFDFSAGDSFDVVLDTFHDQRNGYIFSTNAAGAKSDSQMTNEGCETNASWDWTAP